jgi:gas vesicle protein
MTNTRFEISTTSFFFGLVTGSAIGAALAIACAPRVADLRRRVSATADDVSDAAVRGYQDVTARVADAVNTVTVKGQAVRDDVAEAVAGGARQVEQFAMAAKTATAGRRSS